MTIGYSAAGACWATETEAIDAYYSAQDADLGFYVVSTNYHTVTFQFVKYSGVWKAERVYCNLTTGSCSTTSLTAPTAITGTCTIAESTGSGATTETGLPADFDYTVLAALFAFSFSVVVGLWLFGKSAGSIVNIFKPK